MFDNTHGVVNPKEVRKRIRHLRRELPHITFGVNFHDIRGIGMTNVFVALEEGIRIFNAAIGGIWAAPDMPNGSLDCPTEDLVVMFEEMRIITDIELKKLSSCIDLAEEIAGRKLRK